MKYNNYAHIELNIISKSKGDLGNTANYKNLAKWNNSPQGNITTVGTNGQSSYYGLFDTSGQVYEWTDTADEEYNEQKICRGGCYADNGAFAISKNNRKKFHYDSMLNEGFFGFRIASINNPSNFSYSFVSVTSSGNAPDNCDTSPIGSVNYNYSISSYLITNEHYCEFLNTIDPSGTNQHLIYDIRMNDSPYGGISFKNCNTVGNKYIIKNMMNSKPVTFIKWIMAVKFINWLHHNKSSVPSNIYSGAYNLSNQNITRENNAKYFLPNENEWYKASYFDPNKNNNGPGYWIYGTKSDDPPLAVLSDEYGSAIHAERYHYNNKKFPIIINKEYDTFNIMADSISSSDPCPVISITGGVPTASSNNYLYLINSTISNLQYGSTYSYNFSSSFSNWPCKINPLSGTFVAYSSSQEINAVLEFCPKNFSNVDLCEANLNYDNVNNYIDVAINNLNLSVNPTNACSNPIVQNYLVNMSGLPSIINSNSKYLNIEFLNSHNNAIVVSGDLCCQPLPIIVKVSGHKPGDTYVYELNSSSNSVQLTPNTGIVSFGNQIGKITAFAIGLNNNISILTAKITKQNAPLIASSDQVLLQCIKDCGKSCDNHANFKNKAVWGTCTQTIDCSTDFFNSPISSANTARVTTVGTNGGPSSYNTYDMDGNVWELVHSANLMSNPASYVARGGSYKSNNVGYNSTATMSIPNEEVGFRIGSYSNPYNIIDMVSIQDFGSTPTGNAPDSNGLGKVPYSFKIGKYEVTNCEYVDFLNSVASTGITLSLSDLVYHSGMSGCYGGINRFSCENNFTYQVQECMSHKPVRYVSTYGILKYVNWINNNKPNGWNSSATGTYILNNSIVVSGNRSLCAEYFLPSENEWYKAAYYKGKNTNNTNAGYWDYSTQTDTEPDPISATGCGNGFVDGCNFPIISRNDCSTTPVPSCSPTPTITPTRTLTPTPTPTRTLTPTPTPSPNCCDWSMSGYTILYNPSCEGNWLTSSGQWLKISNNQWNLNILLNCGEYVDTTLTCNPNIILDGSDSACLNKWVYTPNNAPCLSPPYTVTYMTSSNIDSFGWPQNIIDSIKASPWWPQSCTCNIPPAYAVSGTYNPPCNCCPSSSSSSSISSSSSSSSNLDPPSGSSSSSF